MIIRQLVRWRRWPRAIIIKWRVTYVDVHLTFTLDTTYVIDQFECHETDMNLFMKLDVKLHYVKRTVRNRIFRWATRVQIPHRLPSFARMRAIHIRTRKYFMRSKMMTNICNFKFLIAYEGMLLEGQLRESCCFFIFLTQAGGTPDHVPFGWQTRFCDG